MNPAAVGCYEESLLLATQLRARSGDGEVIEFDVQRWLGAADAADTTVIARCLGPVLDVGCGPGRFVHALAERGVMALGLDIAETAVMLTKRRGAPALRRSVFDPTPAEGRWQTVLLMDGNLGIGGDPAALLGRVARLLAPAGRVLVEVTAEADQFERMNLHFVDEDQVGPSFPWALVGLGPLTTIAASLGYGVDESWSASGRRFAALSRGSSTNRSSTR